MEELLNNTLEEVAEEITTTRDIDFLFKWIKRDLIISKLAQKLQEKGVQLPTPQ